MSKVAFFSLGGIDENGKNSYVLEIDDDIFLIDTGVKKPIISRLGVDTIIPSFDYIKRNQEKVRGVFISHIHDENFAALPWLLKEVPNLNIYASNFSIKVIKDRLAKYNVLESSYKIFEFNEPVEISGRKVSSFPLAHSIPGVLGFAFETSDGSVVYTSDYILDHPFKEFGETSLDKIKTAAGDKTLLWVNDCSKGHMEGFSSQRARITNLIYPYMEKAPKNSRIVVGAFDEEMTAIHEILLIAKNLGRPIALYGREYSDLFNFFCEQNPNFVLPKIIPYQKSNVSDNAIIIVSGKGERLYQRFFRIIENDDVYLKIRPTDYMLMVMAPINGHEKMYTKVLDDVMRITTHVLEISSSQFNKFQPRYDDVKSIFKLLKPKYIVPIGGLHRYLYTTVTKLANENLIQEGFCYLLRNGRKVIFENGKYISQNMKVPNVVDVAIDGFGIGDVSETVLREREQLSGQGVIIISIPFELKTTSINGEVQINDHGVFAFDKNSPIYDGIKKIVADSAEKFFESKNFDRREFQDSVRRRTLKFLRKSIDKEPIVIPVLYEF